MILYLSVLDPIRKSLKEGALPTLNLPQKSITLPKPPPPSSSSIQKQEECLLLQQLTPPSPPGFVYKMFLDFQQRIKKLQLDECWNINVRDTLVVVTCISTFAAQV